MRDLEFEEMLRDKIAWDYQRAENEEECYEGIVKYCYCKQCNS